MVQRLETCSDISYSLNFPKKFLSVFSRLAEMPSHCLRREEIGNRYRIRRTEISDNTVLLHIMRTFCGHIKSYDYVMHDMGVVSFI